MRKKTAVFGTITAFAIVLVLVWFITSQSVRKNNAYTGTIVSWNCTDGGTYEIQNLETGEFVTLSPDQYSEIYQDEGFGVSYKDGKLTIALYRGGECTLAFTTEQYSAAAPVLLGECVYYVATEIPDGELWYLWKYEDEQIEKCIETPVLWDSPTVLSQTQLLLTAVTENLGDNAIIVYDTEKKTATSLCKGQSPCYAEQENCIYFINRTAGYKLACYDLLSGKSTLFEIRCGTLCPMAYSYKNNALFIQVDDGQQVSPYYSVYDLRTGHHTVFTHTFCFFMGWWEGTVSAATARRVHWVS